MQNKVFRILQVGMSPYYGGTESFLMNQYRAINRTVLQFDFLNVYEEKIACEDEIKSLGGCIYHLDMARHHGLKSYYRNLDMFFAKNGTIFDAVHCNFQSLINIDILKYAKKYGINIRIAHAHNSGYGTEPNLRQKLITFYNSITLKKYATHYFACSDLAANWMFGHSATIIKNAIDADKFAFSLNTREHVRKQLCLGDSFTVIFVGRLDPQKNPVFMLNIFNELRKIKPNSKLLVVGDGILRNDMEQKIKTLKMENSVQMLGSRNDVNILLQAADVFLLPSMFEGLGIVLIEAQAAGLPTFTSADVVPKDVKISELLKFISLSEDAKYWADEIMKNSSPRKNMKKEVRTAGYDNAKNAEILQNLYLNYMQGQ